MPSRPRRGASRRMTPTPRRSPARAIGAPRSIRSRFGLTALMAVGMPTMRNLDARVQHLERLIAEVVDPAKCRCWEVVHDEEQAPGSCPHGRPWAGVIRIIREDDREKRE
jgi:hypothetical protein